MFKKLNMDVGEGTMLHMNSNHLVCFCFKKALKMVM